MLNKIRTLPPLVTPGEVRSKLIVFVRWTLKLGSQIERLRNKLSQVQRNEAFLLHAGDCAESFDACTRVGSRRSSSILCALKRLRKTSPLKLVLSSPSPSS